MRIAYLLTDSGIPVYGTKGASVHVRELARALTANHAVDLFCATRGDGSYHFPIERLHVAPSIEGQMASDPDLNRDRRRVAVVAALKAMVEAAHREEPYDLIYERYSLFGDAGASLADAHGVPFLLEVNAPLILERGRVEALPLAPLAREIERYAFGRADAIVTVSEAMATYVRAHGGQSDRVHVVPNGVDTELFQPHASGEPVRSELGLVDAFVVGFTGSLKSWHGIDVLLEAFARVAAPNWRLLIVGDGPQRTALVAQARALSISDRVTFTGAVPHGAVPAYIAAMDVAAAPYLPVPDFYFSPLKLFEYQAMEAMVVASGIGQISTLIRHGENGYVVEPGSVEALAEALVYLAANPGIRERLGRNGREGLVTWADIARRVAAIGESVRPQRVAP